MIYSQLSIEVEDMKDLTSEEWDEKMAAICVYIKGVIGAAELTVETMHDDEDEDLFYIITFGWRVKTDMCGADEIYTLFYERIA